MSRAFTLDGNTDILGCDLTGIPMQKFSERDSAENSEVYEQYKKATPARVGIGHTGPRYHTAAALRFQADQYSAANAVQMEVPESVVKNTFSTSTAPTTMLPIWILTIAITGITAFFMLCLKRILL